MSRLKRQIITLALSLGAVLAAKVYLNRKLALMGGAPSEDAQEAAAPDEREAPASITVESGAAPKAEPAHPSTTTGPLATRP